MDKELEKWLGGRNLSKKTLKVLAKEDLVSVEVMRCLTEDDLQMLSSKHSLTMGETVQLRMARDAVIRGELPPPVLEVQVEEDDEVDGGSLRGEEASAPVVSTQSSH